MDLSTKLRIGDLRKKLGGRGTSTIYTDVKEGRLPPPFKLGGTTFWDEAEVDAYLERQFAEQRAARESAQ